MRKENSTSLSFGIFLLHILLELQPKKYLFILLCSPCGNEHTYYCGDLYCAANSIACDSFILNNMNKLKSLQKCENDNSILNA